MYQFPIVRFCGEDCQVKVSKYDNFRTALRLVTLSGEPMCTATVNLPDRDLEINEVFIKDYSENEGVLGALQIAGVVNVIEHFWVGPYNSACARCKLVIKPIV